MRPLFHIPSFYKRVVPNPPLTGIDPQLARALTKTTDELQNIWDQLDLWYPVFSEMRNWVANEVADLLQERNALLEANEVLNARLTELEKELYGE